MSTITPGIEVHLGNTRWLTFRLRRYGQRPAYSAAGAQKILVEFARVGEAPLTPIAASRAAPGADWIAGIVPVLISPADLTARVGTYDVAVTVYDPPVELTASVGRVEVLPRPVAGALPMPGGGSYASTNLQSATNASGALIPAGAPVARTSGGVTLARGFNPYQAADGIAVSACSPGATCLYIAEGQLSLPDWAPVFGTATLPLGAHLYLGGAPGTLTATEPVAAPFGIKQVVCETDADPRRVSLSLDYGVVL